MTYQGNDEIQYPQFSPSSDTVDRWNTHYEEMAATVQQTQNDTLAQGAAQAWAKLEAQIMYQEGSLVSIRFFSDEYYGGAHNMTREFGETIDLAGDHTYTLPELLNTDAATAQQMVNDGFNQLIAQRPDEFFPDTVCDVSANFNEVGYYKTAEGIHVISSLYWLRLFPREPMRFCCSRCRNRKRPLRKEYVKCGKMLETRIFPCYNQKVAKKHACG